jgi:osmotically-inducible protein OsmY
MKSVHLIPAIALAALLAGPLSACSSTATSESTGEYIDDSTVSNKVRADLLSDKDLNVFKIDVTTYKGVVQLSGFVNNEEIRDRAGRVAIGVEGVTAVHNNLIIK